MNFYFITSVLSVLLVSLFFLGGELKNTPQKMNNLFQFTLFYIKYRTKQNKISSYVMEKTFLFQEKMLIDCVNTQLRNGLTEIEEYIERMKAAKEDLESLWSYKQENYGIECDNINLKQSSSTTMLKFGSNRESNK